MHFCRPLSYHFSQSAFAELRGVICWVKVTTASKEESRQEKDCCLQIPAGRKMWQWHRAGIHSFFKCVPEEWKNLLQGITKRKKICLLLTCKLIRSDSGKGTSGLLEHPPLLCHPKYFRLLTAARISKQRRDPLHLPLSLPHQPQVLVEGQRSFHIYFRHVYPVLLCLSGQANI